MLKRTTAILGFCGVLLGGCADAAHQPAETAALPSDHVPADARASLKDYYYYVGTHMALAKHIPYSDSAAFGQCNADLLEDVVPPQAYLVLSRSVKDPAHVGSDPDYKDAYAWLDTSRPDVQARIKSAATEDCPEVYAKHPDLFMTEVLPPPQS